jgi:hypothetical protein
MDLVVANSASNSVSILLGNGDGTFRPAVNIAAQTAPYGVVVGDFNSDGNLDFAVSNTQSNSVSVYLGRGNGTFQAPVNYSTQVSPMGMVARDFNNDGILDLVVVNYCGSSPSCNAPNGSLSFFAGKGDGTFQPQVISPAIAGPVSVAAADFNLDGNMDLAIGGTPYTLVSVQLGNGTGRFGIPYYLSQFGSGVATGDFNGDGIPDVAATGTGSAAGNGTALVFLGKGDGHFQAGAAFGAATGTSFVAGGDLNGDGAADLAATNYNDNSVSVLLNASATTIQFGSNPNPSVVGQAVTFGVQLTPTVTPWVIPTGTVTFASGSKKKVIRVGSKGGAQYSITLNKPGQYTVTAAYSGDANYRPEISNAIVQTVNP